MIRLFTTWYEETNTNRRAEYAECLRANLNHPGIAEVCVIAEHPLPADATSSKLKVVTTTHRPAYDDFIRWINEVAAENDVSIIANTDIYFDESLKSVDLALGSDECFALARWDGKQLFDRNDSQDAWIFRGRVRPVVGDFEVGVPRCDNRFLHELRRAGYAVENPAFAIRANHLHAGVRPEYESDSRAWVKPPYEYLWPHNLLSLPRTLWHNAANPRDAISWRPDWRRAPLNLPARLAKKVRRGGVAKPTSG
ncbi:MAG: hypothetical protein ABI556_09505 [Gemmatimonadales bacterium]